MANNNIGAKIFSQSFNSRDIEATYNKIVSVISKETGKAEDEIKKEIDNLNFGEDLQKKIIEEFEKAEKKIGGKSFSFSKDLFKGLFDSKGSEEEINKVVKIFQSKINSMIEIKNRINDDKIFVQIDDSQMDNLITKMESILALRAKLEEQKSVGERTSGTTKSLKTREKNLDTEIESLRSSFVSVGGGTGVGNNKALEALNQQIKETEENLKKAQKEAEQFKTTLKDVEKAYNKYKNKDSDENALNFQKTFQNYIKSGGDKSKLNKDILEYYDFSKFSVPDNFIPFKEIKVDTEQLEKAEQKVKDLEASLEELYKKRDALSKGGSGEIGTGIGISKEDLESILSVIREIRDTLNQFRDNNAILDSEEINNVKQRISELDSQISEIQTKLKDLNKSSLDGTDNDVNDFKNRLEEVYNQINAVQDKLQGLDDNVFSGMKTDITNLISKFDDMNKQLQEFISLSSNADTSGVISNTNIDSSIEDLEKQIEKKENALRLLENLRRNLTVAEDFTSNDSVFADELPSDEKIREADKELKEVFGANNIFDVEDLISRKNIWLQEVKYSIDEYLQLMSSAKNSKEVDKIDDRFAGVTLSNGIGDFLDNDAVIDGLSNRFGDEIEKTKDELSSLYGNLDKLENKYKQLGNEAQESAKKANEFKNANTSIDGSKSVGKQPKQSPAPDTSGEQKDLTSEQQTFKSLQEAIDKVKSAINEKTEAIQEEESQMKTSVEAEIAKLQELESKLTEIKTQFQNGILSRNPDGGDNVTLEKGVNLKPTLDADTFKRNAEGLLTFVDVEKEVTLKVGDLDLSSAQSVSDENSVLDDTFKNDIEDKKSQISSLLKEYHELSKELQRNEKGEFYQSLFPTLNNLDESEKSFKEQLELRINAYKQFKKAQKKSGYIQIKTDNPIAEDYETGTFRVDEHSIDRVKKSIVSLMLQLDELGIKYDDLFDKTRTKEIMPTYNKAVKSMEEYNAETVRIQSANEKIENSMDSVENKIKSLLNFDSYQFNYEELFDIANIINSARYGNPIFSSANNTDFDGKAEQLLSIVEAAEKAKAALNDVDKEVKNVQDGENGKNNLIPIQIKPEANEEEWFKKINDIIKAINIRKDLAKVQIQPDTSSNEWNEFKTFIKNISDQVIKLNLQMNEDGSVTKKKSTALPSDLNDSYKNSTKYANELYKIKEQIAKATESNNKKELDKLATLKAQQDEFEELLRLEKEFRANDRFSDFDTNSKDDALNKLMATKEQEYLANRNVAASSLASNMASIEDEAWKENEAFDQNKKLEEVNRLLDLQREKWQEINNIRIKMESESGFDDNQIDLDVLEQQKKALMEEVELIQEQLKQYDFLIDKKKEAKKLDAITTDANKTINGGRVVDLDQAYNEANKINEALIKTENMMNRFMNGVNRNDSLFGEAFKNAKNDISEFNRQLESGKIDLTQYNRLVNDLKKSLNIQKDAVAIVNPEDISNMDQIRSILENYMNEATNGTAENLKWNDSARTLTATFKNQNGEIQNVTTAIKDLNNGTSAVTTSFGKAQKPISNWSKLIDELGVKFRNLATYLASFVGFYEIWGAIKQGVTYVRELDTALTEMRKVSDETTQSLREFQEASFDIADSVGATAQVVQNSTAEWMRLGESLEQAAESAQVSNILLNVSEFENIDDATESLVAMSQAYQEFDKIDIVDKLNNIGNNYSIATDGIAEALQRSASSLTTAGNTLDEAIALVTAGNAVVQDPESVGAGKLMPEHIVIYEYLL